MAEEVVAEGAAVPVQLVAPQGLCQILEAFLSPQPAIRLVPAFAPVVVLAGADWWPRWQQDVALSPRSGPSARFVLVTEGDAAALAQGAQAGIRCFVSLREPAAQLLLGIHAAARGQSYCSRDLVPFLMDAVAHPHQNGLTPCRRDGLTPSPAPPSPSAATSGGSASVLAALSAREREVARLAACGLTNGQIGAELGISASTAKTHLRHGYRKLGVANRTALSHRLLAGPPGKSG